MIQGASTKSLVDIDKDGYDDQFLGNRSTWLYKALNMWFNQSEYLLNWEGFRHPYTKDNMHYILPQLYINVMWNSK